MSTLDYDEVAPKTARVIFRFADNCRLAFDDQRKFGEVELIKDIDEFLQTRGLGPDALGISLSQFKATVGKHRGALKAILLNQQLIAGIGNLYADEILFRARMHPATEAARLSDKDLTQLFRAMRHVLEKAIALKTDFIRLPKSWRPDASWKARQMSTLPSRVEISNDRRPHSMVLRALPEASALPCETGYGAA